MSDRPESTAAAPPDPRHPDTWEPWNQVNEGEHPLREVFLAVVHPDYRAALVAPLEFLYHALLALRGPDADAYCGDFGNLREEVAAAVRDLRFTASHLRGGIVGPAQGSTLSYEEEGLCRFAADFSFKLDALTAELETYLANWQPAPEEA